MEHYAFDADGEVKIKPAVDFSLFPGASVFSIVDSLRLKNGVEKIWLPLLNR
jgi:hypothetical protein